ncbi:TetR/AcrR family transcriptional regulator [Prescottella sp. R16]|uniref:TetR/AcrR family transcriptional regulator n=1 Tax=Prescottella sp. R16 TaxID=3064529 RepID=UPI00272E752E|nr:TetR/AcrR family transcriptional regulator [Prescottella sp. R16]
MASSVRAGRPRDAERERELLLATQELLAEVGYDRLSIDAVAARCGAGKTTVYRRWAGKSELVAEAVALLHGAYPDPDTGSLREDLVMAASAWHGADAHRDAVISGLLTAMAHDGELRAAVGAAVTEPRRAVYRAIVDRAVERGEVPAGRDVDLVGTVFPALTFHRITVLARPVDREFIEQVVDHIVLPALTCG